MDDEPKTSTTPPPDASPPEAPRWFARPRNLAIGIALGGAVLALAVVTLSLMPTAPAELLVESEPSGAQVLVDGLFVGTTPLLLSGEAPTRQLRLTLDGHQPLERQVEIVPGQERLTLTLDPLPASLVLESDPPGALVNLDGRALGPTPAMLSGLQPGRYQLALQLPGYAPWQNMIDLRPGGGETRSIRLEPLPASLEIAANVEGANVLLNGEPRGPAPLNLAGLAMGSYELRLEADGLEPWTGYFWLNPGEARRVEAELPIPQIPQLVELTPAAPQHALAIIVENLHAARPQSGLDRADVVFEALAEGGISRFLALYLDSDAPVVGPVRSARHYFVAWATEFAAPLVKIGSSPQGFEVLAALGLPTLDEERAAGFWRSPQRRAPHNAYVSTESARSWLNARGVAGGSWGGLTFKQPEWRYPGPEATRVRVDYGWNYRVEYRYDPDSNTYLRVMAGAPHTDSETGQQLRAASVAVMVVPAWVLDPVGRLDMALVGSGAAHYFLDGVQLSGTWQKDGLGQPTRFFDSEGNPLHFNPGPLWVQVVPATARVDWQS